MAKAPEDKAYIQALIARATEEENFKVRALESPEALISEWTKYIKLQPGKVKLSSNALYMCFSMWAEKFGHPDITAKATLPRVVSVLRKDKRMRTKAVKGLPGFCDHLISCNLNFNSIRLLSRPTKKDWFGLNQKAFRRPVRDRVDQDYTYQLRYEDRAWLSKFNDEFYNGRYYNDDTDLHQSKAEKRKTFRTNLYAHRDTYSILDCVQAMNFINTTPLYLPGVVKDSRTTYSDVASNKLWYNGEDALIDLIDEARAINKKNNAKK